MGLFLFKRFQKFLNLTTNWERKDFKREGIQKICDEAVFMGWVEETIENKDINLLHKWFQERNRKKERI